MQMFIAVQRQVLGKADALNETLFGLCQGGRAVEAISVAEEISTSRREVLGEKDIRYAGSRVLPIEL